ncbi:hypothetical protein, partial [Hydrogenibacillus schlegelii]|uniref:hypothetical protein n=1 Tax=Hydrogenibacillus schlegelii TaxID=1484 RepID=UPI0034A047D1
EAPQGGDEGGPLGGVEDAPRSSTVHRHGLRFDPGVEGLPGFRSSSVFWLSRSSKAFRPA